MKKLILGLLTILTVATSHSQQTEKLDYCNCEDKIEQITPELNGQFERKCNGIIIEKGKFLNGLKIGEWITYSRKGKLIRKLNYENGLLNGKVELFYLKGKPKLIGHFDKGKKTNVWNYYTKKGKVLATGSYDNNIPIDIWVINDKKGKKAVVKYDFKTKKYLLNNPTPIHKDGNIIQNENTEEWYILKSPDLKYNSKPEPLGGYEFANFMFIELVEVPEVFWDTYLYNKYKVNVKVDDDNGTTFNCELFEGNFPQENLELTFLLVTNPTPKIKQIKHSSLEINLLDFKIKEAINFLPPWISNPNNQEIEFYIHYVINENMHRRKQ
jgi:antitoxin component YwqK of YwqJK toxin-antitoxin module